MRLFEAILLCTLSLGLGACASSTTPEPQTRVRLERVPDGGIQPQAVVRGDVVHLIYFKGEPAAGDVFYVRRSVGDTAWSEPLRVNSLPGSAIAIGSVRGAHLAIGRDGRAHVAWMGSAAATPRGPSGATPMLYTRLNGTATGFEPQKNVLRFANGLDGGGSVAADGTGRVYVAWHGHGTEAGEAGRRVWVARSEDDGATFAREEAAFGEPTGACGCCGMRAFADDAGSLYLLYRAAEASTQRGMQLVRLPPDGESTGRRLDEWELQSCPMSTAGIQDVAGRTTAAWERDGQIYYADLDSDAEPIPAPGESGRRKHPALADNDRGEMLLVWTEGTGWNQGGSLAWHVIDARGEPSELHGSAPAVPVWSFATAYDEGRGSFVVLY